MKYSLFLITLIIMLGAPHKLSYAEQFYKWIDENGNVQYSNTLPKQYSEDDPNVELITPAGKIDKKGVFAKRIAHAGSKFITDDEWATKFKEFSTDPPTLPKNKKKALAKVYKIIADQVTFLDIYKTRYAQYVCNYELRKEEYERQMAKNQEAFKLKIWRPTILLETEEQHQKAKDFFLQTINKHELFLEWAKQKKLELDLKKKV